jgi:hypothetical protein
MLTTEEAVTLDTSDVDQWVGKRVIYAEMIDPCNATDIRRWAQALDYPNPIHWDEGFARASKFAGIVAPQSFAVNMDYGHGCHPACVGMIPGSHLIFAGEEWWFYGVAIRPGDHLTQERFFDGYDVTDTSFAGPTMFARGDTIHTNQRGELVAKERATAIRYLVEEAKKREVYAKEKRPPNPGPTPNCSKSTRLGTTGSCPTEKANHCASAKCRSATSCRAACWGRTAR